MKYFAVLILGLWADKSFAGGCNSDCKVNSTLLIDGYRKATERTVSAVPIGKFDLVVHNFQQQYIENSLIYGHSLLNITYDWACERSEHLIKAVRNRICELQKCMKSSKNSKVEPICLKHILKDLTKQFRDFLKLIPGDVLIKRPPLPALPLPPGKIKRTLKISASDIFVNFCQFMDGNLKNFYNIVADVHLTGWKALRPLVDKIQDQYRNEFLYGRLLKEYRRIVDKILQSAKYIQRHVEPKLWDSLKTYCDRIITIYDDYKSSKICQNC